MSSHRPHSERGFTLVELLLAVSLVAVIAAIVFGSLYLSTIAIDRARADAADEQMVRSTLAVMAQELALSVKTSAAPWLGINAQQDGQPADTVAFLSVGQFRGMETALETETVRIVYTRYENRLLRLVRRNLYGSTDESIDRMDLAAQVKGFNIRYYDRTSNVWSDEWDGRVRPGTPSAVLIELMLGQDDADLRTIRQWVSIGVPS
ncbi:MAG TPA: type II secretion system protein [Nitrospira sp.]